MPICHILLINNISVLFIPLFVFSGHTAEGGVIGMACVEAVLHFVSYDSSVIRPEEELVVEAINYKLEIDNSE